MSKPILTILTATIAVLGLGACSMWDDPTSKPPGTYHDSSSSTSSNGTNYKTDKTTDVYTDANGNKKAVVKTQTTKDPEGLFNKSTTTTTKTYN